MRHEVLHNIIWSDSMYWTSQHSWGDQDAHSFHHKSILLIYMGCPVFLPQTALYLTAIKPDWRRRFTQSDRHTTPSAKNQRISQEVVAGGEIRIDLSPPTTLGYTFHVQRQRWTSEWMWKSFLNWTESSVESSHWDDKDVGSVGKTALWQ